MGHRTVPIEMGRNYLAAEAKQKLMTVKKFITRCIVKSTSRNECVEHIYNRRLDAETNGRTSPLDGDADVPESKRMRRKRIREHDSLYTDHTASSFDYNAQVGYLAQHRLVRYICKFPSEDEYLNIIHTLFSLIRFLN